MRPSKITPANRYNTMVRVQLNALRMMMLTPWTLLSNVFAVQQGKQPKYKVE